MGTGIFYFQTNQIFYLMKKLFFLAIAATVMLFSCSKNTSDPNDPVEVRFSGNIAQLQTRVGETTWDATDKVGIFMTSSHDPYGYTVWTDLEEYYANKAYTATSGTTANFTPVDGKPMYYPQDGSEVDVYAYYPYNTTTGNSGFPPYGPEIFVDATDQSDLSAIDILWARELGVDKTSGPISLKFFHMMTKLVFNISYGDELVAPAPEETRYDFVVFDVRTKGQLTIFGGNVAASPDLATVVADGEDKVEIILPPQTHANIAVAIEDGWGEKYNLVIPNGTWAMCNIYTYNVTLKKAGVAALISGTISPWGIGTPIDIDGFLKEE